MDADTVRSVAHDNGRGFDPSRAYEGRGLRSMRERSARVGGELKVESAPERGTTIVLRAPLTRHLLAKSLHERIGGLAPFRRTRNSRGTARVG